MSKTTENSHGTAKKLYTGAVISAVATGLIGSIAQVQASEVKQPLPTDAKTEPALVEKEAPKKVEVKTPTKEEVAELGATAKQTQEASDKAKEVLDQANEQSDKAEKKVADLKQAQADAQKVLDEAKEQNKDHATQVEQAEQAVKTAQANLETKTQEKETAQTNAEKANTTYNHAVSTLNNLQKDTKATITLAPDFIKAVKESMAYSERLRSGENLPSDEEQYENAVKYRKMIIDAQLQNRTLNKYTPSAKDQADETRYDINNLPKEVTDELNYFVADLLNQMRRQLGLPDVVLSKSSLEFANKIAKEYVKADWSHAMIDEYRAKGGAGHYAKGVYKAASEYGLKSGYSEAKDKEYMEKGFQPYENSVTNPFYHDFDDEDGVFRKTIGEMKEKLYDDLIELVSHKNDYLHTQGILQFDYADEVAYFGGVAQSKSDEIYTTHFITSLRSSHVDGSKWDKTPIVNPLSDTNKEQEIAKARQTLADAMNARKDAQAKLEATSKAVSDAQTALTNAQAHLSALNNGENPLANAQKVFNEAKDRHDKAVVTLANANALVNNLTASKATKEETLKDAQAKLDEANKALNLAQDALKAEEDKMVNLEAVASNKAQAVSTAKKALQDAKDQVKQAEKELADFKGAKARLNEVKAELERVEAELKEAYKAQNEAKVDYEVKSLAAGQARTAYETAKAKYEEAETKRLVELADAKRKELEHLGYKPVPVVDNKGNVVDYKAEKVTVGTKDDKTYQAPAQATNAKAESKKQLPNTGTKESGLLALLGASVGLLALAGKRKYNR